VKFEIFLDFFQVAIVVGLVYSTFFFLSAQRMLPRRCAPGRPSRFARIQVSSIPVPATTGFHSNT